MCFEMMFFDLDDTLYPPTTGIWQAIGTRMDQFMMNKLAIPKDSVATLREKLFKEHGTTMRGLVAEYQVDDQEFLDFVHDIPIQNYLSRDELLRKILALYPQQKVIFTNADTHHAKRVLHTLGVNEFFDQVIDIRSIRPFCKPQPEAFALALGLAGITDPSKCVMIDDSYRNLVTANETGLFTIQVGTVVRNPQVDAAIISLADLPSVIPVSSK
ncbi:MAG: putative hydrolase of the HAD superfamily [Chloroflexi bacterium]|nr:MAG: putative hydrolase of the HAD superfamily [Chloroflexota bacterium]MBA4375198.1 pyrimidine 5'-nucleotidase [Anaerolinea sp.]